MVAAGHDTTSFCTCYTLFLLAKNPDIQKKLKAEIKRVMGNRTDITPEVNHPHTHTPTHPPTHPPTLPSCCLDCKGKVRTHPPSPSSQ